MNKTILTVILTVFLVGMFSLAIAAEKTTAKGQQGNETKNMTYGNCVSDAATLKNTCYKTAKTTKESCKTAAQNQTESRQATKICHNDYKTAMKQCKNGFKTEKNTCKKIKHNIFESAKVAFK